MTRTILFTNARDELSILEWTVHHLALGFDHIHIFDHISAIPISSVLQPLVSKGKVTVKRLNEVAINKRLLVEEGYNLALSRNFDWMLYIDADEFVVLNSAATVTEFLVPYATYDQVGMNWLMFGSNGLEAHLKPEQTILESYTKCALNLHEYVKTFFNLKCGKQVHRFDAHMYCLDDYTNSIYQDFHLFTHSCWTYASSQHYTQTNAFVAHYTNQNYSTYINRKINIPTDDNGKYRSLPTKEFFHAEFNELENTFVRDKYNERNKAEIGKLGVAPNYPLDIKYAYAVTTHSNIHEHVPVLRKYASECSSILDLNTGGQESTYGLLKGLSESKSRKTYFGDSTLTDILKPYGIEYSLAATVDLLFINTWHVYGKLKRELEEHSSKVLKYIIMHNTEVDKEDGESVRCGLNIDAQVKSSGYDEIEIRTGLGLAIKEFLRTHSDWEVRERLTNNHGLTVLARKAAVPASAKRWGPSPIGFVVTRHVTSPTTNLYWKECIAQIKLFHPSVPIMIVDDSSNLEYLTTDGVNLENCIVIQSEFPGCGELLAYYYLYKLKPFEKAIFIHDSVFLQQPIAVDEVAEVEYLWDFDNISGVDYPNTVPLLKALKNTEHDLPAVYNSLKRGCFGVMAIVTTSFLARLQVKYNLFSLVDVIKTRGARMGVERVFAVLCKLEVPPEVKIRFGDIGSYIEHYYPWNKYLLQKGTPALSSLPVVKVWTGR